MIFLAILVLAPVVPTLYQSLLDRPLYEAGGVLSLDNYARLFTDAGFGKVALNTALFALLTTALSLLLAVPMAIVVVRTKLPGGGILAAAMQWPFFISSLILGFGWIMMYGPSGFVSVKIQQVLGHVPWNLYSIPGMALTEAVAPSADRLHLLRQRVTAERCFAGVRRASMRRGPAADHLPVSSCRCCGHRSCTARSWSSRCRWRLSACRCLYGQPVNIQVFSTFLFERACSPSTPTTASSAPPRPSSWWSPSAWWCCRPSSSKIPSDSSRCGEKPPVPGCSTSAG